MYFYYNYCIYKIKISLIFRLYFYHVLLYHVLKLLTVFNGFGLRQKHLILTYFHYLKALYTSLHIFALNPPLWNDSYHDSCYFIQLTQISPAFYLVCLYYFICFLMFSSKWLAIHQNTIYQNTSGFQISQTMIHIKEYISYHNSIHRCLTETKTKVPQNNTYHVMANVFFSILFF